MSLGIFGQLDWLTTRVKRLCCAVEEIQQSGAGSYKVYTALLTQSGGDVPSTTVGDETLYKGVTYTIVNLESGDNLIPYGAPNNEIGTSFVCNQEITNWANPLSTVSWNSGAPVVTVLENTIGNIWFTYDSVGQYLVNSDGLFINNKTVFFATNINEIDTTLVFLTPSGAPNNISIASSNFLGVWTNGLLSNTPIEIRVYN